MNTARELTRRTMHGGTGWMAGVVSRDRYQPQDQNGVCEMMADRPAADSTRCTVIASEPTDARITGGTRSLMRRLSGLNLGSPKRVAGRTVLPA